MDGERPELDPDRRPAANIYVGETTFLATDPATGNLLKYNPPDSWGQIDGLRKMFDVTHDNTIYGLTSAGAFQWLGGQNWSQIGQPMATIAG